jgi:predicted DNA binding CopG/RHH family protein
MDERMFEPLDREEEALRSSLEADEWRPVADPAEEKEKARAAARNTLKKDKRINLRLSQRDFHRIRVRAVEEGIPYQTLISSIIHKYLDGV